MKCPKCKNGNLRVEEDVLFDMDHHPLICDNCFSFFTVDNGEPAGPSKLPPEFSIKFNREMTESVNYLQNDMKTAWKFSIIKYPLLEDFKKKLK